MSEYYDTQTEIWHTSNESLPNSRGNTVGLRNAPDALLIDHGILPGTTLSTPDGMVHTGAYTIASDDRESTRTPVCITEAAHAAQQAHAVAQQAQDDLAAFGLHIGRLAQALSAFHTIPAGSSFEVCQEHMTATLQAATIEQYKPLNIAKDTAQTIYQRILTPQGITGDRLWAAIAAL